jgi:hypothetical protein
VDLGDFPFIHDPATHKRRPGDQKSMRYFRDGRQATFFCRIAKCEKSVNGHRPGDLNDTFFYDPSVDPSSNLPDDRTWAKLVYECGCFVTMGMC